MLRIATNVVLIALSIATGSQTGAVGQTVDEPRQIHVDDIGRSVILIGRLGKPLGHQMRVRGKWSFPDEAVKDFSARFTIHHVDGKRLERPVELNIAQLNAMTRDHQNALPPHSKQRSLDGQEWRMLAYEVGYIDLIPDEYHDERPPVFPVVGHPYFTEPFTSKIVAVVTSVDGAGWVLPEAKKSPGDAQPLQQPTLRPRHR